MSPAGGGRGGRGRRGRRGRGGRGGRGSATDWRTSTRSTERNSISTSGSRTRKHKKGQSGRRQRVVAASTVAVLGEEQQARHQRHHGAATIAESAGELIARQVPVVPDPPALAPSRHLRIPAPPPPPRPPAPPEVLLTDPPRMRHPPPSTGRSAPSATLEDPPRAKNSTTRFREVAAPHPGSVPPAAFHSPDDSVVGDAAVPAAEWSDVDLLPQRARGMEMAQTVLEVPEEAESAQFVFGREVEQRKMPAVPDSAFSLPPRRDVEDRDGLPISERLPVKMPPLPQRPDFGPEASFSWGPKVIQQAPEESAQVPAENRIAVVVAAEELDSTPSMTQRMEGKLPAKPLVPLIHPFSGPELSLARRPDVVLWAPLERPAPISRKEEGTTRVVRVAEEEEPDTRPLAKVKRSGDGTRVAVITAEEEHSLPSLAPASPIPEKHSNVDRHSSGPASTAPRPTRQPADRATEPAAIRQRAEVLMDRPCGVVWPSLPGGGWAGTVGGAGFTSKSKMSLHQTEEDHNARAVPKADGASLHESGNKTSTSSEIESDGVAPAVPAPECPAYEEKGRKQVGSTEPGSIVRDDENLKYFDKNRESEANHVKELAAENASPEVARTEDKDCVQSDAPESSPLRQYCPDPTLREARPQQDNHQRSNTGKQIQPELSEGQSEQDTMLTIERCTLNDEKDKRGGREQLLDGSPSASVDACSVRPGGVALAGQKQTQHRSAEFAQNMPLLELAEAIPRVSVVSSAVIVEASASNRPETPSVERTRDWHIADVGPAVEWIPNEVPRLERQLAEEGTIDLAVERMDAEDTGGHRAGVLGWPCRVVHPSVLGDRWMGHGARVVPKADGVGFNAKAGANPASSEIETSKGSPAVPTPERPADKEQGREQVCSADQGSSVHDEKSVDATPESKAVHVKELATENASPEVVRTENKDCSRSDAPESSPLRQSRPEPTRQEARPHQEDHRRSGAVTQIQPEVSECHSEQDASFATGWRKTRKHEKGEGGGQEQLLDGSPSASIDVGLAESRGVALAGHEQAQCRAAAGFAGDMAEAIAAVSVGASAVVAEAAASKRHSSTRVELTYSAQGGQTADAALAAGRILNEVARSDGQSADEGTFDTAIGSKDAENTGAITGFLLGTPWREEKRHTKQLPADNQAGIDRFVPKDNSAERAAGSSESCSESVVIAPVVALVKESSEEEVAIERVDKDRSLPRLSCCPILGELIKPCGLVRAEDEDCVDEEIGIVTKQFLPNESSPLVTCESTAEKGLKNNISPDEEMILRYIEAGVLERVSSPRLTSLFVSVVPLVPLLLLFLADGSRFCPLIGRTKYDFLLSLLPVTSTLAGNRVLQSDYSAKKDLQSSRYTKETFLKYLKKDIKSASPSAAVMAAAVSVFAFILGGLNMTYALGVGIAALLCIITAATIGASAPILFQTFFGSSLDQYEESAVTVVQDTVGGFLMVNVSYLLFLFFPLAVDKNDDCA